MTITNFNQSHNGVNISLDIYLDGDYARILEEESIKQSGDLFIFVDCGNFDADGFRKTFYIDGTGQSLFEKYYEHHWDEHFSLSTEETRKTLLDEMDLDLSELSNITALQSAIETHIGSQSEMDEFLEKHFKPKYFSVITRGYCQGDYREVIVPHALLETIGLPLTQESADSFKEEIHHLCWDTPIYAKLAVNGSVFEIQDKLSDIYNYDEEEIRKIASDLIKEESTKAIVDDFLSEQLPSHLDYVQ
ncbi:hypothetical protein KW882_01270 [Vibrio parahaemolyticus]